MLQVLLQTAHDIFALLACRDALEPGLASVRLQRSLGPVPTSNIYPLLSKKSGEKKQDEQENCPYTLW